jgi:hypothetical protein
MQLAIFPVILMKDVLDIRWNYKYFVTLWPLWPEQPAYTQCINTSLCCVVDGKQGLLNLQGFYNSIQY